MLFFFLFLFVCVCVFTTTCPINNTYNVPSYLPYNSRGMASVGTLAEEAQKRKERLKALRNRQNKAPAEGEPPEKKAVGDSEWETLPK